MLLTVFPAIALTEDSGPSANLVAGTGQESPVQADTGTFTGLKVKADSTWQRLNRSAMSATRIPPEMPGLLARILTLAPTEADSERLRLFGEALDGYIDELEAIERDPGVFGSLSTPVLGPFGAGSWQQIVQIYEVGSVPIEPGGGLLLTSHWSTPIVFQSVDPNGDNFIKVSSSNPGVIFSFKRLLRGGIHGGLDKAGETLFLEVSDGQLEPGDTVQIDYGSSRGIQVPARSTDGFSLPVYVRLVEDGHFNSLQVPSFQILGESIQSISVVAPSIVQARQAFNVHITGRDRYGNKASGLIPSFDILINNNYYTRIESSYEALGSIDGLVIAEPGLYTIDVRSSGGGISATANPIKVVRDLTHEIRWGELARTTDVSIGQGSIDYELRVASTEDRLDFIAVTDTDSMIDDWEWERLLDATGRYAGVNGFQAFPGFLRSLPAEKGGSQAVILQGRSKMPRITQHEVPLLVEFYKKLRDVYPARDVLVVPNTVRIGDWRFVDPGYVSLVEIKTALGFFEWYGQKYLDRGYRLGFAGSNDLTQGPELLFPGGLTAVMVNRDAFPGTGAGSDSPGRASLFAAMKSGRTYVTSGNRMILDFKVNGGRPGDRVQAATGRHVAGEIAGTGPLESIEVIKSGLPVWSKSFYSASLDSQQAGTILLNVQFYSDSMSAINQFKSPPPATQWIGFISTSSGSFRNLATPALKRSERQRAIINPANSRRIDFITQTRGNQSSFTVELDSVTDDLVLDITIMENKLVQMSPVPAGIHKKISLMELYKGPVTRNINEGGMNGYLSLETVEPQTENTFSFDFTDSGNLESTDYYYLKVKQQDGNYGWSSPIWVGGFDLN